MADKKWHRLASAEMGTRIADLRQRACWHTCVHCGASTRDDWENQVMDSGYLYVWCRECGAFYREQDGWILPARKTNG